MVIVTVTLNTSTDRTIEVPRFTVGGHLKGRLVRLQPAGKGVNVSRGLAALGVPSTATGLVGRREAGLFRESFAGTPTSVELVPVEGTTRSNTTILDPARGTDTHVREAGFEVLPREIERLRARLRELASPDALFVFCGSLPPGVRHGDLASLLAACNDAGARVAADLNGPQLGLAVDAAPRLIKPNVAELAELLNASLGDGGESALVRAARGLCDRVDTVLLTRGRLGALAVTADVALAASVEVGEARNTVGCGDAALAGYLAGLWRGASPEQCLAQAVACGGASALSEAAGEVEPGLVAQLLARTTVRRLA